MYLLIFEGVERETLMCCSTYLCIHCVLAGDPTYNLGVLGWCSNQMSYPARATTNPFTEELSNHPLAGEMFTLWETHRNQDERGQAHSCVLHHIPCAYVPWIELVSEAPIVDSLSSFFPQALVLKCGLVKYTYDVIPLHSCYSFGASVGNRKRMIYLGSVALGQLAGIYRSLLTDLFGVYFGVSRTSFRKKRNF